MLRVCKIIRISSFYVARLLLLHITFVPHIYIAATESNTIVNNNSAGKIFATLYIVLYVQKMENYVWKTFSYSLANTNNYQYFVLHIYNRKNVVFNVCNNIQRLMRRASCVIIYFWKINFHVQTRCIYLFNFVFLYLTIHNIHYMINVK